MALSREIFAAGAIEMKFALPSSLKKIELWVLRYKKFFSKVKFKTSVLKRLKGANDEI